MVSHIPSLWCDELGNIEYDVYYIKKKFHLNPHTLRYNIQFVGNVGIEKQDKQWQKKTARLIQRAGIPCDKLG